MSTFSTGSNMLPGAAPRRRAIHGVSIGILVLDTQFHRLPGDIGNGTTWRFPVQYAVVRGATPDRIVRPTLDTDVVDLFVRAADELVAFGVDGITTSCGFLALLHPQLVARCQVPVATSALLQIPLVQSMLPAGKRVGVLTMDKTALTAAHFQAVGAPTDLPVGSIPNDGIFRRNHRTSAPVVRHADHEAEVVAAAEELLREHPEIGALVLECTNLPPYSATLEARFQLPVYDIVTLVEWFHSGLRPRRY
ncbi:aspartate/glutamate racemase family protein [Roseomonas sp. CAU 1739]|uniref:aspartate/glutamate racemase family protein n=1 Tax=Roseomonas sp. CAU 1739 TaxID=3140364 RepID=UPI00325BAFC7